VRKREERVTINQLWSPLIFFAMGEGKNKKHT